MLHASTLRTNGDVLLWPEIRIAAPKRYELLSDYVIEWEAGKFPRQRLVVPKGFICDAASIPNLLMWYLEREKILPAAVAHDWHYAFAGRIPRDSHFFLNAHGAWVPADHVWTREEADRFFARNLRFCNGISDGQRRNAYRAVRLSGWMPWRRASKRNPS
jgi:hypothetical protein